ncbi:MAG: MFS transporter [Planctomycetota bacterium]
MDKKVVRAWCFYDFGNSAFAVLFTAIFSVYYQDIIVGGKDGIFWWGLTISLSMAAVAISSPFMGGIADHAGIRKRMLAIYTALGIVAVLGFTQLDAGMAVAGFAIALVANFAFEGGVVFYNAYLPEIAPASHHGRVSAWGFAVGYVGSLLALVIAVAVFEISMTLVWIALAVQWAIGATPALLFLPKDKPGGMTVAAAARKGFRQTATTIRSVIRMPNLRRFLIGYFFYIDGVNTVIAMASVYASKELNFETSELFMLFGVVQLSALAGSMAMAKPTDAKGPKWAVQWSLVWWILVVLAAFFAETKGVFWGVAVLAGLGLGSIQAASRAFMSRLIPKGREAELFGFYALCGKSGAILGPVLFGTLAKIFESQRPAILTVAVFYIIGLVFLRKVKEEATDLDSASGASD